MYYIKGAIWHTEKYNWEHGCDYETAQSQSVEFNITAESLEECIRELKVQTYSKNIELDFNSCDEQGRIDIQWSSLKPFSFNRFNSKSDKYNSFVNGYIDCYLNIFSIVVEQSCHADLSDIVAKFK